MAKLQWHVTGEKRYETGVKDVALFISKDTFKETDTSDYIDGVAWNGITAVNETPSGGEASDLYADDEKYLSLYSEEELGVSVEAYTYPDEWGICDGSATVGGGLELKQQIRKMFGLAYITTVGNDINGNAEGEKLHLLYGCKAAPSDRSYSTINESPEAITFSWELTTTKQPVPENFKKTALITIDTTKLEGGKDNETYKTLKNLVYGTDSSEPTLPKASSVIEMFMGEQVKYTYVLLTSEPEDWATKYYTDYYIIDGLKFVLISIGEGAPEFAANTYYKKEVVSEG